MKRGYYERSCSACNREVENEIVFCNFCGAFAGNESVKADDTKVVAKKNIIIAVSVLIVLSAIMLFVFVFDIFGLKKAGGAEHIGKGRPLFSWNVYLLVELKLEPHRKPLSDDGLNKPGNICSVHRGDADRRFQVRVGG